MAIAINRETEEVFNDCIGKSVQEKFAAVNKKSMNLNKHSF